MNEQEQLFHHTASPCTDVDTRRRAACDLVQSLSKSFEGPVIQNFSTYIQGLLQVILQLFHSLMF